MIATNEKINMKIVGNTDNWNSTSFTLRLFKYNENHSVMY